jgi:hypothetical protein
MHTLCIHLLAKEHILVFQSFRIRDMQNLGELLESLFSSEFLSKGCNEYTPVPRTALPPAITAVVHISFSNAPYCLHNALAQLRSTPQSPWRAGCSSKAWMWSGAHQQTPPQPVRAGRQGLHGYSSWQKSAVLQVCCWVLILGL